MMAALVPLRLKAAPTPLNVFFWKYRARWWFEVQYIFFIFTPNIEKLDPISRAHIFSGWVGENPLPTMRFGAGIDFFLGEAKIPSRRLT